MKKLVRVLILEHSRIFQKMLSEILEDLDCTVDCVRSGQEGLEKVKNQAYSLILAGQHIFDETGADFAKYCHDHIDSCRIVLLTSEPNETLMNNARNAGITDIFPKANLTYLRSNLRYYIEGESEITVDGGRILYVEDSASVSHIIIKYLEDMNIEVNHFTNAEKAFKELLKNNYDLVITDILLSGMMDGVSLARMIKSQENHIAQIPILAMTANDDPKKRIELFRAGINDYVTKPPIKEELVARVANMITNKRLVDQVREQKRTLYQAAMKDQLTTCHNRHSLAEFAPKYINDSKRYKFPLCAMILDLDYFKAINDTHGHTTGDIVLETIGKLLMQLCRQGDFVARIGGEEFLILLPHCYPSDAEEKAEEIRAAIENCKPHGLNITASLGVARLSAEHKGVFDNLYKAADDAVYHSKENGRNQVTFADDLLSLRSHG